MGQTVKAPPVARTSTSGSIARVDEARLMKRLHDLGQIGEDPRGGRTRLALTDADKVARDMVVGWMEQAGADVQIDAIGNIYGIIDGTTEGRPVMVGSHIDTIVCAGAYDGCYGVLSGIEILEHFRSRRIRPARGFVVTVFTNEEGARFCPDLMGSRVIARDIALDAALAARCDEGPTVGEELRRIGYAGSWSPWAIRPEWFVELHVEQGPVLEAEGVTLGIVEGVQGHSWWKVEVTGVANHAGTTPMALRRDAGAAAMRLALGILSRSERTGAPAVATIGSIAFEPNTINVVPGKARVTLDLRDHRDAALRGADDALVAGTNALTDAGFEVDLQSVSRYPPVAFNSDLCHLLEHVAHELGVPRRRLISGASHDAQMMASLSPSAMLFVPSCGGISHNPSEHTSPESLATGANVLLHSVLRLAGQ